MPFKAHQQFIFYFKNSVLETLDIQEMFLEQCIKDSIKNILRINRVNDGKFNFFL